MAVDIVVESVIHRPPTDVAAFAGDPTNVCEWYVNIQSVEWETAPPAVLGSRMRFVATFLGKRLAYTYEVVELEPNRKMVMRTAEGPFPMETVYTWEPVGDDSTRMTLQNRGEPAGFSGLMAPLMSMAMKRAMTKDLALLKSILESGSNP